MSKNNYRQVFLLDEIRTKAEWHNISVFKPYLRDTVLEHVTKG